MDIFNCDKCGREVKTKDNAVRLEQEAFPSHAFGLFWAKPRHILPIVENGEIICAGSPSRAQYLEGQPKSSDYPYLPEHEAAWRAAYEIVRVIEGRQ